MTDVTMLVVLAVLLAAATYFCLDLGDTPTAERWAAQAQHLCNMLASRCALLKLECACARVCFANFV